MAYIPDPNDATEPTDAIAAETAQAEFRALKAKVNTLSAGVVTGTGARNIVVNGTLDFGQVQGGPAIASNTSVADSWKFLSNVAGKFDSLLTAILPPPPLTSYPSGYTNQLVMTTNGPAYIPAIGDNFILTNLVEGLELRHLSYGVNGFGSRASTLLFWYRSSVVGQHCVSIRNSPASVSFVGTFQVTVANTWVRYAIPVPGCNLGTWAINNTLGATINFNLGAGATFRCPIGQENTWVVGNFLTANASVDVVNQPLGSNIHVTGLEWKDGIYDIGAPPEVLPFTLGFLRVKRYYHSQALFIPVGGVNPNVGFIYFQVSMRVPPIVTGGGPGFSTTQLSTDGVGFNQTLGALLTLTFDARL